MRQEKIFIVDENSKNSREVLESATFNIVAEYADQLWRSFEQHISEYQNNRDSLRTQTELQVANTRFDKTFNFSQYIAMSNAWSELVKLLPSEKTTRLALAKHCVQEIEAFNLSQSNKKFMDRAETPQEQVRGYKLIVALLMNDRTVPTGELISAEDLRLTTNFIINLKTAVSLALVLNRDCLTPDFLDKKIADESAKKSVRWEDTFLDALLDFMKREQSENIDHSQVSDEVMKFAVFSKRVKNGEIFLVSIEAKKTKTFFGSNQVKSIQIRYEDQTGEIKIMEIQASMRGQSFQDLQQVFGFDEAKKCTHILFSYNSATSEPELTRHTQDYNKIGNHIIYSETEKVATNQLTRMQLHGLEEQRNVAQETSDNLNLLPSIVAAELEYAMIQPVHTAGRLSPQQVNFIDIEKFLKDFPTTPIVPNFHWKIEGHRVFLIADTNLLPALLATSSARGGYEFTLGDSHLPTSTETFESIDHLGLKKQTEWATYLTPNSPSVFMIYSIAGNIVVLSLTNPREEDSGLSYSATLSSRDSVPATREDLVLLHSFLKEPLDEDSVKKFADLHLTRVFQSELDQPTKRELAQTIICYVRDEFGITLLDRSVMQVKSRDILAKGDQEEDYGDNEELATKKKKNQVVGKTEVETQLSDWKKFLRYITQSNAGFTEKILNDFQTVDFGTDTEAYLILLFNEYRDRPDELSKFLHETLLAEVLKSEKIDESSRTGKLSRAVYRIFLGKGVGSHVNNLVQSTIMKGWRELRKDSQVTSKRVIYGQQQVDRLVQMAERYWENISYAKAEERRTAGKLKNSERLDIDYRKENQDSLDLLTKAKELVNRLLRKN